MKFATKTMQFVAMGALAALFGMPLTQARTYSTLYKFTGKKDGQNPFIGLVRDPAGNLYGAAGNVVFKLDPAGNETVFHRFSGGAGGSGPNSLIRDAAGNFYGTAFGGSGSGLVFKLDQNGNETVLYNFAGGADGAFPVGVIQDAAGNFYGATGGGGIGQCLGAPGCGTVFKLDPAGNHTVLYTFTGGSDGGYPRAGVTSDDAGNLYGTTEFGGADGFGVVFRLDTTGTYTVLHSFGFGDADGQNPLTGVILDKAGNVYGVTSSGGPSRTCDCGVVFKLDSSGNETLLHVFRGGRDGSNPNALIQDASGTLYGTTQFGGSRCNFCGVLFKMDTAGKETVLYSFSTNGDQPQAALIQDSAGNLYGTTFEGGKKPPASRCRGGCGVVFKLAP